MFILGVFLNLLSSYFLASIAGSFLVVYVAFFAIVILNIEVLSLFSAINSVNITIFSFFNLILSFLLFRKTSSDFLKFHFDFKKFKNSLSLDKTLIVLLIAFLILISVILFLAVIMPPLEPDSQTYHFLRVIEFFKNHNLNHFETNDARALVMPINSEIIYLWMLNLKNNFYGFGMVSFASLITIIGAIYSIMKQFKFSLRTVLWTIFIICSLPAVIVQSSSLQTDIIIGALLITTIALYLKDNKYSLYFSSLALAVAFGVKSTGVMAIFSIFFIIFSFEYYILKTKNLKKIKNFTLLLMLNFFIFSSYNYILNFIQFHNPLSNHASYLGHKFWGGYKGFIANIINYFFQSFDFTGFKWGYYLNDKILFLKNILFDFIRISPYTGCNVELEKVNILTDEQIIGFGILGFLVYLPSVFYSTVKVFFNKNKKTKLLFIFSIAFIINILVLSLSVGYMVFSIRFIVAFVILSSICLGGFYLSKSYFRFIILFFMLFYMVIMPFYIKRMPFFKIVDNLKKNNFNIDKFTTDCFENKITPVLELAEEIKITLEKKYKNHQKIGIFKTTDSALLYLKTLKNIETDFLNVANIDKYDLNHYDLIIMEGKIQDDNVFNPEDIKINYHMKDNKIIFDKTDKIQCYYVSIENNPKNALRRWCLGYDYMIKNKNFKLDYLQKVKLKEADYGIELYYFIKH